MRFDSSRGFHFGPVANVSLGARLISERTGVQFPPGLLLWHVGDFSIAKFHSECNRSSGARPRVQIGNQVRR